MISLLYNKRVSRYNDSKRRKLMALAISLALLMLVSACGAAPEAPVPTEKPVSAEMPVSPVSPVSPIPAPGKNLPMKQSDKLSQRLQALADNAALQKQDAETQAAALSLPASGPGSLMRNDQGNILVNIRLDALSQANLDTLKEMSSVNIVHEAEEFRAVTAYVAPSQLSALTRLDMVEHVSEELTPQ